MNLDAEWSRNMSTSSSGEDRSYEVVSSLEAGNVKWMPDELFV
jgi:hypothetical protein